MQFLGQCLAYHETATHLFLHAGYLPNLPLDQQPGEALRWRVTEASTALPHCSGKTAVVGHTPQRSGQILDLGFLQCIDTNCCRGGWLTASFQAEVLQKTCKEVGMSPKDNSIVTLPTLESLRRHVQETLCAHDNLDPGQTPFFQSLVTRAEKACGLFFQVQGPRQVRNYAIWAGEENRILFYDSQGQRFAEVRLSEAPDPRTLTPAKPRTRSAA